MTSVAGPIGIGGAAHLKVLHPREEPQQLFGQVISIEAGAFQGDQQLVGGFER